MEENRIYRRNFLLNVLLEGFWGLGGGFVVPTTILAIFLTNFTPSKIVIGLLFTIPALGSSLTPIFSAYYTGKFAKKKIPLVYLHIGYVICWFIISILTFLAKRFSAEGIITLFFIFYGLSSAIIGFIIPPYFDYIGKVLHKRRGTYFGIALATSGGLSILGAFLARKILSSVPFPQNYGFCFFSASIFQLLSILFLGLNVESEESPVPERKGLGIFLRDIAGILKRDKRYLRLFVVQVLMSFGGMSSSFYAVYASSRLQLTAGMLGYFTVMLVLGGMVASILLGILGDMLGHSLSLFIAIACGITSALIALAGSSVSHFYLLFFLLGFSLTPTYIACTNLILEIATIEQRSSYLALNSSFVGPFAAVAPLIGGFLIRTFSYSLVFSLTIAVLFAGLLVLIPGNKLGKGNLF